MVYKIIFDLSAIDLNIFCGQLRSLGDVVLANGFVYFRGININMAKIKKFLKKFGLDNFYITELSLTSAPQEGEFINNWFVEFNQQQLQCQFEQQHQKELRDYKEKMELATALLSKSLVLKNKQEGGSANE